jgi:hypothetical protein
MNRAPDFYLAIAEPDTDFKPRAGFAEKRLAGRPGGDDYLLARLEPPIIGQPYGLGDQDIAEVILATRYAGSSLHPISEWPVVVFVPRVLNDRIQDLGRATREDYEPIMIANIYPTLEDAIAASGKPEDWRT